MKTPQPLRLAALVYWALGVGFAILAGTRPSPWFPRYSEAFTYPLGRVVGVGLLISCEIAALYAILRWLPVHPFWRFAVATAASVGALVADLAASSTDRPGIDYANGAFLLLVVASLMVATISVGVHALVRRSSSQAPGNAA